MTAAFPLRNLMVSRRGYRRGFTLIELLVVVAILGVLAALLFPTLARARERGYQAACASNLRQLADAFTAYTHDWDDTFVPHLPAALDPTGAGDPWDRRLLTYVNNPRLYVCPGNPDGTFSYSYNAGLAQPERYAGPYRVKPKEFRAAEWSDIREPAETILLFDVFNDDPDLRGMIGERDVWGKTVEQMVQGSYPGDRDLVEAYRLEAAQQRGIEIPAEVWPRHYRGTNFAFTDGHVRWYSRLDKDYHLPPS